MYVHVAMHACLSKSLTELSSPVPMACNIIDRIAASYSQSVTIKETFAILSDQND